MGVPSPSSLPNMTRRPTRAKTAERICEFGKQPLEFGKRCPECVKGRPECSKKNHEQNSVVKNLESVLNRPNIPFENNSCSHAPPRPSPTAGSINCATSHSLTSAPPDIDCHREVISQFWRGHGTTVYTCALQISRNPARQGNAWVNGWPSFCRVAAHKEMGAT